MIEPEFATWKDKNGAVIAPFLLYLWDSSSVYKALNILRLCTYFYVST